MPALVHDIFRFLRAVSLRHLVQGVAVVCAAAILNFFVAWVCIAINSNTPSRKGPFLNPRDDRYVVFISSGIGFQHVRESLLETAICEMAGEFPGPYEQNVWWRELPTEFNVGNEFCRAGWPNLSLHAWREADIAGFDPGASLSPPTTARWGVAVSRPSQSAQPVHRMSITLPLRPDWGGFVFNTLLYCPVCLACWALLGLLRSWRRMSRRKLHACAECGYPRGGSNTCTECGAHHGSSG